MKSIFSEIWSFTKELFANYSEHNAFSLGASLAYYTVFSLSPILVILMAITSIFVGQQAIEGEIHKDLSELFGSETATQLQSLVEAAYTSGHTTWATIIGIITLIIGATTFFNEMRYSMNLLWNIKEKPANSVLHFLKSRLLSFSFIVGLGFILLTSLTLNSIVIGFAGSLAEYVGLEEETVSFVSFSMALFMIVLMFALLFKYLPTAKVSWSAVWVGGLFTAILFEIGKYLIGLYIGHSAVASSFGAAGSIIVLLVWIYYSSQILFLGTVFTHLWSERYGIPIQPDKDAVQVIRQEIIVNN